MGPQLNLESNKAHNGRMQEQLRRRFSLLQCVDEANIDAPGCAFASV